MGRKTIKELERELSFSYTENLKLNRDSANPVVKEVIHMLGDRALSLSLRKSIMN
jgi:hypothetical protein